MPNEWIADEDQARHVLVLKCADAFAVKTLKRTLFARGFPLDKLCDEIRTEVLIVRAQAIRVRIPTESRGFVATSLLAFVFKESFSLSSPMHRACSSPTSFPGLFPCHLQGKSPGNEVGSSHDQQIQYNTILYWQLPIGAFQWQQLIADITIPPSIFFSCKLI